MTIKVALKPAIINNVLEIYLAITISFLVIGKLTNTFLFYFSPHDKKKYK